MNLSNELLALRTPLGMRFLQLVFEIANFGISFRRVFLGNGASHDLCGPSQLEDLSGHFQLLLFPFRLGSQEGLFEFRPFLGNTI